MKHLCLGVALLAMSTALRAQDSRDAQSPAEPTAPDAPLELIPVQPLPPPDDEAPRQLEEMVVTAQKTEQTLQEVPVSVTAIDGGFIQATGSADLADVSLYVPNVRVDADDLGSPQVFIRGFGTNAFNPSFESSVGFVQDEIVFGRPGYFTEAMFDIDSVEVLRGPQGTLFGKNTVAGVFNVMTKDAVSGAGADGRVFYGEHGEHRVEAGLGGMVNAWLGGRLAVLDRAQEGELFNAFLQRPEERLEQQAARLKINLVPSYTVDSELTAVISDTEAAFWPFQLFGLDEDTREYLQDFDPDIEDDPKNFINSADTPGWIEKGSRTLGWRTSWAPGPVGALDDLETTLVLWISHRPISAGSTTMRTMTSCRPNCDSPATGRPRSAGVTGSSSWPVRSGLNPATPCWRGCLPAKTSAPMPSPMMPSSSSPETGQAAARWFCCRGLAPPWYRCWRTTTTSSITTRTFNPPPCSGR